jgi:hypothetical protein
MTDVATLRVLADNPAEIDLLGLSAMSAAVRDIVCADNSEPITIGLHGPWGSGKSSLLQQLRVELRSEERTVVFELNPWEFADDEDVKGAIISTVLGDLVKHTADPTLLQRLRDLARRISWKRATKLLTQGALAFQGEPMSLIGTLADLVDMMPSDESEGAGSAPPANLTGFKDEFASIMQDLDVDRVVILVDDLDRCLPTAVLSVLEAVKLFLAVPKMAFVIAADQQMVREAIAAGLGETRRSALFARDYLEKIVQIPITVPQPTRDDAECYVALLLAHRSAHDGLDLRELSQHAETRRASGERPYAAGTDGAHVTPAHLSEAKLIVAGLGTDDVVNPRRMKRFVNALAVREHTASHSGIELDTDVIAKLFMLEHRFLPQMTELASLPEAERSATLESWEAWARGDESGTSPGHPEDDLRTFLAGEPLLAGRDVERYFVLARKLIKATFLGGLSEEATACLHGLLSSENAQVDRAAEQLVGMAPEQAALVVEELTTQLASSTEPDRLLHALVAAADVGVAGEAGIEALRARRGDLTAGVAARMAASAQPDLVRLAGELTDEADVPPLARNTLSRNG